MFTHKGSCSTRHFPHLQHPTGRCPASRFHPSHYFEMSALINSDSMVPLYIFQIILVNFSVALSSKNYILGPNSMSIYNSNKYYKLVIIARYISMNSIVRVVSLASPPHPVPCFPLFGFSFPTGWSHRARDHSLLPQRAEGQRQPLSVPDENSPVAFFFLCSRWPLLPSRRIAGSQLSLDRGPVHSTGNPWNLTIH